MYACVMSLWRHDSVCVHVSVYMRVIQTSSRQGTSDASLLVHQPLFPMKRLQVRSRQGADAENPRLNGTVIVSHSAR